MKIENKTTRLISEFKADYKNWPYKPCIWGMFGGLLIGTFSWYFVIPGDKTTGEWVLTDSNRIPHELIMLGPALTGGLWGTFIGRKSCK